MNTDKAIEFQANLYKVNNALQRFKSIGLDVSKFESATQEIVDACTKEINNDYNSLLVTSSAFATDLLEMPYVKGITQLQNLYHELTKYEIYLQVSSFCGVLKDFLAKEDIKPIELDNLRNQLLNMLNGVKKSNTLDYEVEGALVEDIYHLAYEFIKQEIKVTGSSVTLGLLKADEIHTLNLNRQITRELENFNLKEERYKLVVKKKNELDMAGLDANYLNEDFLICLSNASVTFEEYQHKLDILIAKLNQYYNKAEEVTRDINYNKGRIDDQKKIVRESKGDIKDSIPLTLVSLGITLGLVAGSFFLSNLASTSKKYKTTKYTYHERYDEYGNNNIEEEYLKYDKEGVFLYEYTPFVEVPDGTFQRQVTKYDMSDFGDDEPYTYYFTFKQWGEELGLKGEITTETKESLTLEDYDLLGKNYIYVEKITVDKNDYIKERNNSLYAFLIFLALLGSALLDLVIEIAMIDTDFNYDFGYGAIVGLRDIIENIKDILNSNKTIKEKKEEIARLETELQQIYRENEDLINQINQVLPYVESTPEFKKQKREIDRTISLVRKLKKEM